jgi:hypothetical protein
LLANRSVPGRDRPPVENPEGTKGLVQVTSLPPMWARLIVVRCEVVQANHLVMTETGLKRVIKIDRGAT